MKFYRHAAYTDPEIVFAWLPVLVVDRTRIVAYHAWLERVERRLTVVQGITAWAYSPITKKVPK